MNRSLYAVLHVFDERAHADNTNIDSEKNKTIMSRHLIYLFLSFDDTIIAFRDRNVKWFLAKNGKNFALALYRVKENRQKFHKPVKIFTSRYCEFFNNLWRIRLC